MTIPTTAKAITETPANTPRPIGNTSNFFPGGSKVVAAPAFSGLEDGDWAEGDVLEGWDRGTGDEDMTLSGSGVTEPSLVLVLSGAEQRSQQQHP